MSSSTDPSQSKASGWAPELPLTVPAPLRWPPRPLAVLKYLFGFPGLLFPWLVVYVGIAFGLWLILQTTRADLSHLSVGWIGLLLICNELIAFGFYGAWHHVLYGKRLQGDQFKYNTAWPRERSPLFLFGRPLLSNIFWSLVSGVPIWTAYLVLTLWAQASGIIRVASWTQSPLYCSALLFGLVFVHVFHFYSTHRLLHWQRLYDAVHYLHHANANPSPWTGLAMHPVEHLLYFSGVLLLWIVPATPLHVIYFVTLVGLAPAEGHAGFGKIVVWGRQFPTDNYYHYLHHKYFKVNFGDAHLIPLDRWFGTFHDGIRRVSGRNQD